jgi:hypothetical protein
VNKLLYVAGSSLVCFDQFDDIHHMHGQTHAYAVVRRVLNLVFGFFDRCTRRGAQAIVRDDWTLSVYLDQLYWMGTVLAGKGLVFD